MTCFPKKKEKEIIDALLQTSFDIENAFLLLKDRDNLGFFAFSDKDDEIVKRNFEDKDDKNEEYIELVNIKGLEDVIRRKEFLFNVKIDRSQYNKVEEESPGGKVENVGSVDKKENNDSLESSLFESLSPKKKTENKPSNTITDKKSSDNISLDDNTKTNFLIQKKDPNFKPDKVYKEDEIGKTLKEKGYKDLFFNDDMRFFK